MNRVNGWLCIENTPYGSLSRCGIAFPWECGKSRSIDVEEVDEKIKILTASHLHGLNEEEAKSVWDELAESVKELKYRPKEASAFAQLVYLVNLSEEQNSYSAEEKLAFDRYVDARIYAKRWLRLAGVMIPLLALPPFIENVQISMITSLAIGVMLTAAAWAGTGSNPDYKSDMANGRQDVLNRLPDLFQRIAAELVDLKNLSFPLAEVLANRLDVEFIARKMKEEDPSADAPPSSLCDLEAAKNFILGKPLPESVSLGLRACIEQKHGKPYRIGDSFVVSSSEGIFLEKAVLEIDKIHSELHPHPLDRIV